VSDIAVAVRPSDILGVAAGNHQLADNLVPAAVLPVAAADNHQQVADNLAPAVAGNPKADNHRSAAVRPTVVADIPAAVAADNRMACPLVPAAEWDNPWEVQGSSDSLAAAHP
jgi:hypothetical protein